MAILGIELNDAAIEAVGFIVLLPNINEAIHDLGEKLLPFGWAKLVWRLKANKIHGARVPLMGVRKDVARSVAGKLLPFRMIADPFTRHDTWLIVDLGAPEFETRVAIIRKKADERSQTLEEGVAEAVAKAPLKNVRELGGILNTVGFFSHR